MRRPPHRLDPPDLHGRLGLRGLRRREPAVLIARRLVIALCATAALAGCGGEDKPSAPSEPTDLQLAEQWVKAVDDRDWERACDLSDPAGEPRKACLQVLQAGFEKEKVFLSKRTPPFEASIQASDAIKIQLEITRPKGKRLVDFSFLVPKQQQGGGQQGQ